MILTEIEGILSGLRFIRAAGIADAVTVGPLRAESEATTVAAIQRLSATIHSDRCRHLVL